MLMYATILLCLQFSKHKLRRKKLISDKLFCRLHKQKTMNSIVI